MKKWIEKILEFFSFKIISPLKWEFLKFFFTGRAYDLKPVDREYARDLMKTNMYLWLTRRDTHLTTYLICFSDFALALVVWAHNRFKGKRPRFGYWSHAFINIDDNEIVEAIAKGVTRNYFDDAFDVDGACALLPRFITPEEWAEVQVRLREQLGKNIGLGYDTIFNLADGQKVSCIELVRKVLREVVKDYDIKFKDFEDAIKTYKNLTPQMLYDSKSFRVVWEIRR